MEQNILIWPQATTNTILQILGFVFFFIAVLMIFALMYQSRVKESSDWSHIFRYAVQNRLDSKEIKIVEDFFKSQPKSIQHRLSMLNDKTLFREALLKKFSHGHSKLNEEYVVILDRLFPVKGNLDTPIRSYMDLHIGEICNFEIDQYFCLATVLRKSPTELLISSKYEKFPSSLYNKLAGIYIFRNEVGSYLLKGLVAEADDHNIRMIFNGEIIYKGHEHILTEVRKSIVLKPIPNNNSEIKEIHAYTKKVSEKALLLELNIPSFDEDKISSGISWETTLDLDKGKTIHLKGNLQRSKDLGDTAFVYRFHFTKESENQDLLSFLKGHNAKYGIISMIP
jgi:hypothetical protein